MYDAYVKLKARILCFQQGASMPDEPQDNNITDEYVEPSTGTDTFEPTSTEQESTNSLMHDEQPVIPTDNKPSGFEAPMEAVTTPVSPLESQVTSTSTLVDTRKNKKTLLIVLILAVVLAVLVGGGSLVYGLWYQNPNKVVTDALMNAVTAKSSTYAGTMNIDSNGTKAVIGLNAKQTGATGSVDTTIDVNTSGKSIALNGSVLVDSAGDYYLKVGKLTALVADFKDFIDSFASSSQSTAINQLVSKIDGNWIKVSNSDLKDVSATTATATTCTNDAMTKFQNDKAAISELTDRYKNNSFINIDKSLGVKDGSYGYSIKTDQVALKAFLESLKTTKIYTALHACDSTFTIDSSAIAASLTDTNNSTFELWVNSWSHQITKVNFNDSASDGTTIALTIAPTFNQPVQISTPQSSVTLSQLKTDIEALLQGSVSGLTTKTSSTLTSTNASTVSMYADNYAANNRGVYPTLTQLKALIPSVNNIVISSTVAVATSPNTIGYVVCGVKGADISYYNSSTKAVIHESVGRC